MPDICLNPDQVTEMIKQAEQEGEVIVIRCLRKTEASKPGGPDVGQFYDLHCSSKPKGFKSAGFKNRKEEDKRNGVLTVFVTNRQNPGTGIWGDWRRVNINRVKKIIFKTKEYEVICR